MMIESCGWPRKKLPNSSFFTVPSESIPAPCVVSAQHPGRNEGRIHHRDMVCGSWLGAMRWPEELWHEVTTVGWQTWVLRCVFCWHSQHGDLWSLNHSTGLQRDNRRCWHLAWEAKVETGCLATAWRYHFLGSYWLLSRLIGFFVDLKLHHSRDVGCCGWCLEAVSQL